MPSLLSMGSAGARDFRAPSLMPERETLPDSGERDASSPQRRRWTAEDKRRIASESFAPGSSALAVARQYSLNPSQVFAWRRKLRGTAKDMPHAEPSPGLAILTAPDANEPAPHPSLADSVSGAIDVMIGRFTVRVSGDVNPDVLRQVLNVVSALPQRQHRTND